MRFTESLLRSVCYAEGIGVERTVNPFMLTLVFALLFSLSGTAPHATAVWLSGPAPAPQPGKFEMHNVNRTFTPEALVVPVGSEVRFPNDDPYYHSIFSTDKANGFDVGYYDTGPGKYVTFSHPGVVEVRCHIHGYMHGTIVVADGPFSAVNDGKFQISGVPAGKYTLHQVADDGSVRTSDVTIDRDTTLNL
jgi:plastocyanin